jgi:hypothetical protein
MQPRQWFQARLRWAVLEEGQGLCQWGEAEHIFLSEDREAAFQEALRLGYAGEYSLIPTPDQKDAPTIDCRFAEVEYLEELGTGRAAFEVYLGEKPAREGIGFEHEFDPAAQRAGPDFLIARSW